MSIIMQDIAYLNDQLFTENKKLKAQAEYDNELIRDLGKQLKQARETIERLEAQLKDVTETDRGRNRIPEDDPFGLGTRRGICEERVQRHHPITTRFIAID